MGVLGAGMESGAGVLSRKYVEIVGGVLLGFGQYCLGSLG